ncbi:helix-turn-helix domain-containing protein [Shewanella sp. SG41-4]|uniref:helix-turn-helix domain-containing protein n=1 Tax=Shewanella sp. SG41-4 TaxID=2760976 RepID=UPI001602D6EE|nr:helix-turn-helix domain-containing protein [Shewanella sp. SG41-4]MBB1441435.1 helix-turn-helix domain-containing protein [Shewanella sp. SG41-4]
MTINYSFNDNILAISIKIDELITSIVTLAKAMKTSYVHCSRNGWHFCGWHFCDVKREAIKKLLLAGETYSSIQQVIGCSPYLVQQVSRELKQDQEVK